MDDAAFESSDSSRTPSVVRYAQRVTFATPLALELGGQLPSVTVTYETYGQLNARRDNAVLVCHAISGDSHVACHDKDDAPGWWDVLVGAGQAIDTERYFVICSNILGGCRGSTGPNSINPQTGQPYGADFPAITVGDMVEVQRRLIDHLGIDSLHAVIGGSLGGHQALTWAVRHPARLRGCVALATSPRLTSQALAFDVVGRNAILHDPGYCGGQYYTGGDGGPVVGLALARMLAHITYLSRQSMTAKFDPSRLQPKDIATAFEKKFSVGSYLAYQGHKFVERFDANSYVTLSMAMDLFDLGDTPELLRAAFAASACRWLVISFTSDWLFPPEQSRQIVDALIAAHRPVSYCNVAASGGHDAFLLEEKRSIYGGLVHAFLAHVDGPPASAPSRAAAPPGDEPTSIFHGQRLDADLILELIPPGASVLDLGCGAGELLSQLRDRGHRRLVGVELDERAVLAGVDRGLNIVQHDLETGLAPFADGQFDVVLLSQTLQSIVDTEGIIDEMLRVGGCGIVSFPNFAYYKIRTMLYEQGRSPKAEGVYRFEWYNTPNRRFPSIADVEDFCAAKGIRMHRKLYLDSETHRRITDDPNRNADVAIFVLSRSPSSDGVLSFRRSALIVLAATLLAGAAPAAYFHEAHKSDALDVSAFALKAGFVVTGVPRAASLPGAAAAEILAAPDAEGLFEQAGGMRIPAGRCGEDGPQARPCERKWETGNLARANGVASRRAGTLTLKSRGGQTLALRDWEKCAPRHECDGEHFTYLGPLGRSTYLAAEIGYGHDSPSLILFHAQTGKLLLVHYGSEPTFLNPSGTLLVSSEDLNDATSLLVSDLGGAAPAIDLQCLAVRTVEKSFAVAFKRWDSDSGFDVVFTESGKAAETAGAPSRTLPVRVERRYDGTWTVMGSVDLKAAGVECRQRRPTAVK